MALQKVSSNSLYYNSDVNEDRAVFMTPNYVADIFGAFGNAPHTYDLPWHWIGDLSVNLPLSSRSTSDFNVPGYNSINNVMHASSNGAWNASIAMENGHIAQFWAAANPGTEVITGNGHIYEIGKSSESQPPLFIERQSNVNNALFGSVIDISGANYITGVSEQSLTNSGAGFASLLHIQHGNLSDLAFTSYAPGTYSSSADGFSTDALQAAIVNDARELQGAFLGGGTTLSTPQVTLVRADVTTPGAGGMAAIEHMPDGSWLLSNPSPSDAKIQLTLNLPGIALHKSVLVKASSSVTLRN